MVSALRAKLTNRLKRYLNQEELQLVDRAYEFARSAHKGAKRASGEEYLTHPLSVALILADLELDAETIAAALLHDVCEDTPFTPAELTRTFGPEITSLVAGVTKLGRIKLKHDSTFLPRFFQRRAEEQLQFERQVEYLRKMLLAMSSDIRIILIKLADRLHNMRTLSAVRPDKRARIAQETLEVYAPLAYRLGMGEIKGELEDRAFPYVYPNEYRTLREQLGERITEREAYVQRYMRVLRTYLEGEGLTVASIHGRVKHLYSLWRKLQRYDGDLAKIYDLVAIRVIVTSPDDCYRALGLIHSRWNPLLGRIKDYIATPKPNDYRSLHTTVFGLDGEIVEVQIRTDQMHEQAERGIAAHWHYSEEKTRARRDAQADSAEKLEWLTELRRWQASLKDPHELKHVLQLDFFSDRIFVFTPQGDIIKLPAGSTPVDFAYAIHSDVGNACTGAKVNGKLIPLTTKLENGDIVEVITSRQASGPKRDWLRFVATQKARSHIKAKFNLS